MFNVLGLFLCVVLYLLSYFSIKSQLDKYTCSTFIRSLACEYDMNSNRHLLLERTTISPAEPLSLVRCFNKLSCGFDSWKPILLIGDVQGCFEFELFWHIWKTLVLLSTLTFKYFLSILLFWAGDLVWKLLGHFW